MAEISNISIETLRSFIRPTVRQAHTYRVGGPRDLPVKLNQNESPFDLPPSLKARILEKFQQIPWNRYPTEQPEALQHALARKLDLSPESILIGNGSNELTYTIGLSLIQSQSPVVLPRPMFALYEKVVHLYEGKLILIAPRPDYHFDIEALIKAIRTHHPILTVVTTPNNPTGLAIPYESVERIVQEASGFVLIDEAYVEFTDGQGMLPLLHKYPHVLLMRTFSKAFGLAGLRIGYLLGHPSIIQEFMKSRLPFMVDRLAETVALTLLEQETLVQEHVKFLIQERNRMLQELHSWDAIEVLPSQTNFFLLRTPLPAEQLVAALAQEGVLVRNVSSYPSLKNFVRVNVGTPTENSLFIQALKKTLQAR